jgi:hypothetical protein
MEQDASPREVPQIRAASPEQDSAGQTGTGWQPGAPRRPQPPATDQPADEPVTIAFSPEFLAQVLGQVETPRHSAEGFSDAARAYQALQEKEPPVLFIDPPERFDFDA